MSTTIMTWNIQRFATGKSQNDAIRSAIAQTITQEDVDIFIVVELMPGDLAVLNHLKEEINENLPLNKTRYKSYYSPKSVTGTEYTAVNERTYGERFGFLVKDSITPQGFSQALTESNYYIKIDTQNPVQPNPLNGETKEDSKTGTIQNSFYLLDRNFRCGRPPCLAQFDVGGQNLLYVMAVHLAPQPQWAVKQIQDSILPFQWTQETSKELIITGDFNFDPNDWEEVVAYLKLFELEPMITADSTHVGSNGDETLLDNFYYRQNSQSPPPKVNKVIAMNKILTNLYDGGNCKVSLNNYLTAHPWGNNQHGQTAYNNFLQKGPSQITHQENVEIYRKFISDHFPIVLTIN